MSFKTEQENFWSGEFGSSYISRNNDPQLVASNIHMFAKVLERTSGVNSMIEYGANIGLNIQALKKIKPSMQLNAVEINKSAFEVLSKIEGVKARNESILECSIKEQFDLVLFKGVLIHIDPNSLKKAYELAYRTSKKYIVFCEYYNPAPVALDYRGEKNKLFKRDFAGEIMSLYPDLKLVDYGFVYRNDPNFPQDDITWFLMEKK